jgi:hypothetical protein
VAPGAVAQQAPEVESSSTAGRRTAGFGTILATLFTAYVAVIGLGGTLSGPIRVLVFGVVLVVAARLRACGGWRVRLAATSGALSLAVSIAPLVLGAGRLATALTAGAILLLGLATTVVMAQVLLRRPVADGQTVLGALSVYLMLALLFAASHQLLAALLGQPYLTGVTSAGDSAAYLYYSVITLTTVGLGDIAPACSAARSVTMTEALTGQLYLVAVVGTVIGHWKSPRRRAAGNTDQAD